MLAMPSHRANVAAAALIQAQGYKGRIAAATRYPDEAIELEKAGVEFAFNIYTEAGTGFANDLLKRL